MKLFSTLFILVALTACGKKAEFDGRKAGPTTPVDGGGINVSDYSLVRSQTLNSSINYTEGVEEDTYNTSRPRTGAMNIQSSEVFKFPAEVVVFDTDSNDSVGWAGLNDTVEIVATRNNVLLVKCTYTSQATKTNDDPSNTHEERQRGLKYVNPHCSTSGVTTESFIEGATKVSLIVMSADKLVGLTTVSTEIEVFE